MSRILLSLTMAVLVTMVCACAKNASPRGQPRPRKTVEERFAELDVNKDGKLSLQEFLGHATQPDHIEILEKAFKDADTNHDGFLSLDEYKAYAEKVAGGGGADKAPMGGNSEFVQTTNSSRAVSLKKRARIVPRHVPSPMRRNPSRSQNPRRITSSPSSRNFRCSPVGRVTGSLAARSQLQQASARGFGSAPETVPLASRSPERRLQPLLAWCVSICAIVQYMSRKLLRPRTAGAMPASRMRGREQRNLQPQSSATVSPDRSGREDKATARDRPLGARKRARETEPALPS